MTSQSEKFAAGRAAMVEAQLRRRGIRDAQVLSVMGEVPREAFMPADMGPVAYLDGAQPIGLDQTISQPYVVALMTEALELAPAHRVLEIGTGSGYQTAILARLAGHIYSIERLAELAETARSVLETLGIDNVTVHVGDGTLGWAEEAPFDRILCAAAAPEVPAAWVAQLADGGRMVLPVGPRESQQLLLVGKRGEALTRKRLCDVRFVPLLGQDGW